MGVLDYLRKKWNSYMDSHNIGKIEKEINRIQGIHEVKAREQDRICDLTPAHYSIRELEIVNGMLKSAQKAVEKISLDNAELGGLIQKLDSCKNNFEVWVTAYKMRQKGASEKQVCHECDEIMGYNL